MLAFSLFLWRGAYFVWQPVRGRREWGKEMAPPRPTGPVVTLGTMGTGHYVLQFGAGPSGVNETAGTMFVGDWRFDWYLILL